ncbi:hypothetical protein Tco_0638402 [Tanacetum coccineum]
MASPKASISKPSKKPKFTIIPPKQLFIDLTNEDAITPSPKLQESSPSAPNAPSKTPSTKDTLSSSIDYTPKLPTLSSSLSTNGYLNSPLSPPPRVPPPPPTQAPNSIEITLSLSPITPLDVHHNSPSLSPPIIGHPIPWKLLETHGLPQAQKITSLKLRVKKLKKKGGSRTQKLKRLYKGRKIHDIDADEDITLENVHDAEMFDVNDLHGHGLRFIALILKKKKKNDLQGKMMKPMIALTENVMIFRRLKTATKRAEKQRNKPPTKAQQKKTMITYLKNMEGWRHKDLRSKDFDYIKELFGKAFKRVNIFVDYITELVEDSPKKAEAEIAQESSSKRAGDELEQENAKKQKVDDDQEAAKMKELMKIVPDEEEVAIDAIPLATKPPSIID